MTTEKCLHGKLPPQLLESPELLGVRFPVQRLKKQIPVLRAQMLHPSPLYRLIEGKIIGGELAGRRRRRNRGDKREVRGIHASSSAPKLAKNATDGIAPPQTRAPVNWKVHHNQAKEAEQGYCQNNCLFLRKPERKDTRLSYSSARKKTYDGKSQPSRITLPDAPIQIAARTTPPPAKTTTVLQQS